MTIILINDRYISTFIYMFKNIWNNQKKVNKLWIIHKINHVNISYGNDEWLSKCLIFYHVSFIWVSAIKDFGEILIIDLECIWQGIVQVIVFYICFYPFSVIQCIHMLINLLYIWFDFLMITACMCVEGVFFSPAQRSLVLKKLGTWY